MGGSSDVDNDDDVGDNDYDNDVDDDDNHADDVNSDSGADDGDDGGAYMRNGVLTTMHILIHIRTHLTISKLLTHLFYEFYPGTCTCTKLTLNECGR